MQAIAGPESASDTPLFPPHSSHIFWHERAGWGRQNWVCPRARETLGTSLSTASVVANDVYSPLQQLMLLLTAEVLAKLFK